LAYVVQEVMNAMYAQMEIVNNQTTAGILDSVVMIHHMKENVLHLKTMTARIHICANIMGNVKQVTVIVYNNAKARHFLYRETKFFNSLNMGFR